MCNIKNVLYIKGNQIKNRVVKMVKCYYIPMNVIFLYIYKKRTCIVSSLQKTTTITKKKVGATKYRFDSV